jgi:ubiquinone/menaquinone biosynthesis C-methylase UbiE
MPEEKARFYTQSNLDFRLMALTYKLRDFIKPRREILGEVGIKVGFHVLDYGCGPGSYVVSLARLVGDKGKIYALDINPLAVEAIQKIAAKKRLANVYTILSDCETGLLPDSLDVILLYDILHDLGNSREVLLELRRVLKPEGFLSVSDHHLNFDDLVSRIEEGGLFKLSARGRSTCNFTIK